MIIFFLNLFVLHGRWARRKDINRTATFESFYERDSLCGGNLVSGISSRHYSSSRNLVDHLQYQSYGLDFKLSSTLFSFKIMDVKCEFPTFKPLPLRDIGNIISLFFSAESRFTTVKFEFGCLVSPASNY